MHKLDKTETLVTTDDKPKVREIIETDSMSLYFQFDSIYISF